MHRGRADYPKTKSGRLRHSLLKRSCYEKYPDVYGQEYTARFIGPRRPRFLDTNPPLLAESGLADIEPLEFQRREGRTEAQKFAGKEAYERRQKAAEAQKKEAKSHANWTNPGKKKNQANTRTGRPSMARSLFNAITG